ncbi:DUF397 domain-containing protein [Streptoalloteichus hindustanus]|uniref:DUF397 domain-containing protein n=1 Tax=Streptoalloteichus hindustanus TaxID=2017 RepID=UPI0013564634
MIRIWWKSSSRSAGNGGGCAEITSLPGRFPLRDGKNRCGGHPVASRSLSSMFIESVEADASDLR